MKFKSIQKGYTSFCSTKCLSNDPTIKNVMRVFYFFKMQHSRHFKNNIIPFFLFLQ